MSELLNFLLFFERNMLGPFRYRSGLVKIDLVNSDWRPLGQPIWAQQSGFGTGDEAWASLLLLMWHRWHASVHLLAQGWLWG